MLGVPPPPPAANKGRKTRPHCSFSQRQKRQKGEERSFFLLSISLPLHSTMASREEQEAAAERAFTAIGMAPSTVQ